jgi:hypothetical protein
VKLRKRYLPVAAVLGAAVAIVPALAAGPSEAKLEVNENCVESDWQCWTIPGPDPRPASITIAVGEVVTFADKTSFAANITWTGATAPMCSGAVPVSPAAAATDWEGTCKFEQPGTYVLEDARMFYPEATVKVVEAGNTGTTSTTTTTTTTPTTTTTTPTTTTTTPTTTTPTTTTPTTTTPTATTPMATTSTQPYGGGASTGATPYTATTPGSTETPPSPGGNHPLATLALANSQHGDAVHGTVQIPPADGGARLEVELLAQGASLAKVRRPGSSRVGRFVRSSAPAGKVPFTVSLDAAAKLALRHRHKLALTVKIVLTPKHGAAITLTRSVVVR